MVKEGGGLNEIEPVWICFVFLSELAGNADREVIFPRTPGPKGSHGAPFSDAVSEYRDLGVRSFLGDSGASRLTNGAERR